ncbi:MAG: twin-arginine translocase subunit TatC [Cellvibrionales bacterium]|nr:twin-arginine translocase subunit TatC [Cellvibrionales bacterium]
MTQATTEPLVMHLLELRRRLLRVVVVLVVLAGALLGFANDIYHWFAAPLLQVLPEGSQMIATEVASPFLTPFKLTVVCAFFIAIPYVLMEVWGFLAPALYRHEKRWILPLFFSSLILFYAGIAFAYFVVFPVIFAFFSLQSPEGVAYTPDINQFFNTVMKLFFAFGFAFQVPVLTLVLTLTGAMDIQQISKKRPYVIVGCFIVGMLLTPPDPISQAMMAVPMWLLFEIGVLVSRLALSFKPSDAKA